jgi:hypothetical protein
LIRSDRGYGVKCPMDTAALRISKPPQCCTSTPALYKIRLSQRHHTCFAKPFVDAGFHNARIVLEVHMYTFHEASLLLQRIKIDHRTRQPRSQRQSAYAQTERPSQYRTSSNNQVAATSITNTRYRLEHEASIKHGHTRSSATDTAVRMKSSIFKHIASTNPK